MHSYPTIDWSEHPLHLAATSGNTTEVERLIAEDADVNEVLNLSVAGQGRLAGTPLHVAIRKCHDDAVHYRAHHEVVKALLSAGANVQLCRIWEGTPLHDAARFGLVGIADMLISHGADANSKGDYHGRTPLHLAAANRQLAMVDFLLAKGAEIDAIIERPYSKNYDTSPYCRQFGNSLSRKVGFGGGDTPLQMSASIGHVEIVKRLIERGACLNIATAIDLAKSSKCHFEPQYAEIIALLEESQARSARTD